jgi:hypothetical protein
MERLEREDRGMLHRRTSCHGPRAPKRAVSASRVPGSSQQS